MLTVALNGTDLHIADQGPQDAPALIFSNSLGTDFRVWDALIPHLPAGLRLVRYDKRGHGLSRENDGPYRISTLADDAAALIAHLRLTRPVFVGLSIGGLIGMDLAARYPGLLAGLVVSNSAAKIGEPQMWRDRIAMIRAEGLASIAVPTMDRWFSPEFRRAGRDAAWSRMLARQPKGGYIACCEAIAGADLRDAAAGLALPVQCIAGAHDGATPPELVRATADLIPGARFALIPDAAHIPCVETPAAHAAIITDFLKETGHV
ncbi:3-oxoadipate enol-lactonase [Paracoccus sp. (in: a-proteobacteria)]|uniref:3-oxoadipate enol-lactonase n=1 Tax=Paracoccus sp. TaxID=267 RepID=UPI0026DF8C57|nr:3-oxoadipate enol-lactonase [Paracoccus sp. (in: a-proteobacteria)]MDO5647505.1 3-oxoadipate enol-lactonase [Paracoccus sp. (in: a-proteobacteria)]